MLYKGKAKQSSQMTINTITREDLADEVGVVLRRNKINLCANTLVDQVLAEMTAMIKSTNKLKVPGFGTWEYRQKVARPGRNPKTGEEYMVPARKTLSFYKSRKLKAKVNE